MNEGHFLDKFQSVGGLIGHVKHSEIICFLLHRNIIAALGLTE